MISRFAICAAFVCAWCLCGEILAQQPTTVDVAVRAGKRWTGIVDTKSNDDKLVLRFERGGAVLWRPIAWEDIREVSLAGKSLPASELKARLPELATAPLSKTERAKLNPVPATELAPSEEKPPLPPAKVISIACDALLANWDGDVEADGLVLHLQPIDAWQGVVPASGTIEVELHALEARAFHLASNSRGRSLHPIARWTQAVNLTDFGPRGAAIQFPFQAAHPEFDDRLGWYGLVHIKFSVPGSGVFEQSIDGVRIRPWAPLRDYLQMDTGYRFLPHETTGRGKSSWYTDDQ
ncbi:hypothetical protein NA78x_004531 [Anatilimnocola sp. NA78]|uniref:hypothetical protein n=1 Tax=Anatilimnocola sp. NA78 TaxID=3415683 RepID=UPI003CE4B44F